MQISARGCLAGGSLAAASRPKRSSRGQAYVSCASGQGFGPSGAQPRVERRKVKGFKPKTEFKENEALSKLSEQERAILRAKEVLGAKAPPQGFPDQAPQEAPRAVPQDFEARLAALKAEGAARAAAAAPAAADAPKAPLLPFEAPPPPSAAAAAAAADPASEEEKGSPGWFRFGAVAALAVFLLVYGASSDLVLGTGSGGGAPSAQALSAEERKKLEALAGKFDPAAGAAAATAEDALNAAKALATLGKFDESAAAYRAAYSAAQGGDAAAAVALPGEVDSLTRAGRFEAAARAADAFAVARGADVAAGRIPDLDSIDLELLRAKARVTWPGHEEEALRAYDALVGAAKEDFRPVLGKGLALAAVGRQSEAERALIEARFLAPKDARPLVDKAIRAAGVGGKEKPKDLWDAVGRTG